ncbi:hypothetical protein [Nonomuraea sp. JJY05]|uniref:hypothetical protein n=1 Tax=Nonomuraea sp. JJY05 TaxID=3350255 RepID=UPI00373E75B7
MQPPLFLETDPAVEEPGFDPPALPQAPGRDADQLARSRRAHFARRLLDDSDLTVLDVALASGFGSLRQFNRTSARCSAPRRPTYASGGTAPPT